MILRIIQALILGFGTVQGAFLTKHFIRERERGLQPKTIGIYWVMGFIFNFFDYLGIGSFAPSLACYRLTGTVSDEEIPGTLVTGAVIPVAVEALVSLSIIEVEITTLFIMYACAVLGAVLGGKQAVKLKVNTLRKFMGCALLIAATLMLASKFQLMPLGGTAIGLHGIRLVIGGAGAAVLAALLTVGIGNYAPTMVLVYMLGMNPAVSFPIMMGIGCLSIAGGSFPYFESGRYNKQAALGFALAGIPGVVIAAFIVKALPLNALQWLVIIVCIYTGISMLVQAFGEGRKHESET